MNTIWNWIEYGKKIDDNDGKKLNLFNFIRLFTLVYVLKSCGFLLLFILHFIQKKFVHRLDFTSIELTWQLSRGWMWMWIWNFINGTRKRRVDRQENLNKFPIPLHPSLKMSTRLTFFSLDSLFVVVVILFWFSNRHLSTFDAIKWKRLEAIIFWWD